MAEAIPGTGGEPPVPIHNPVQLASVWETSTSHYDTHEQVIGYLKERSEAALKKEMDEVPDMAYEALMKYYSTRTIAEATNERYVDEKVPLALPNEDAELIPATRFHASHTTTPDLEMQSKLLSYTLTAYGRSGMEVASSNTLYLATKAVLHYVDISRARLKKAQKEIAVLKGGLHLATNEATLLRKEVNRLRGRLNEPPLPRRRFHKGDKKYYQMHTGKRTKIEAFDTTKKMHEHLNLPHFADVDLVKEVEERQKQIEEDKVVSDSEDDEAGLTDEDGEDGNEEDMGEPDEGEMNDDEIEQAINDGEFDELLVEEFDMDHDDEEDMND